MVPRGVMVERFLDGGHKDLKKTCPPPVEKLLDSKSLRKTYDKLIDKFINKGRRNDMWLEPQLVKILQEFQDGAAAFREKGVKVNLCIYNYCGSNSSLPYSSMNSSNNKSITNVKKEKFRWLWLEFVDTTSGLVPSSYSSPYDVTGYHVVLDGLYMVPPSGVVVEQLKDASARTLVRTCPPEVHQFMEQRGLTTVYQQLTETLLETAKTRNWVDSWRTSQVLTVVETFQEEFRVKGVEVVVCKYEKAEWEFCKWLEFIDRNEVTDETYWPAHNVDEETLDRQFSMGNFSSFSRRDEHKDAVVVEPLVIHGQPNLLGECPPEVEALLVRKDLLQEYAKLDLAISASKEMRNFLDIWRMTTAGIISFPSVEDFQSTFMAKGVKVILCESVGKGGAGHFWLEYVDIEASPDYFTPFNICLDSVGIKMPSGEEQGSRMHQSVAGGRHWVPIGVAVEELGELSKVTDDCPDDVRELLTEKGLMSTYGDFIETLAKKKSTRGWTSNWKGSEILTVMEDYAAVFKARGVKMVICKLKPDSGRSYRWFEYINVSVAPAYVAQYDMSNYGDEELGTVGTTLKFPNGVAVEKLSDRKAVVEDVPESVRDLLEKKDCFDLYVSLVDVLCESGSIDLEHGFTENQVRAIAKILGPKFEANGGMYQMNVMSADSKKEEFSLNHLIYRNYT